MIGPPHDRRSAARTTMRSAPFVVLMLVACTPWLTPPSKSIRLTGSVQAADSGLVEIEVYERCSRRFVFFSRCPGALLGQTKIAKPGPFLVQIAPDSQEVSIVAFRGSAPKESVCTAKTVSLDQLEERLELAVTEGPCPLQRPSSLAGAGGGYTSASGTHGGHGH